MKTKRLYRNKVHELDFLTASIIFIQTVLYLVSWQLEKGKAAVICDPGNGYLINFYPRLCTWSFWFFALYFFLKIFRFKACIYTIIVTVFFFIIQTVGVLAFEIGFDVAVYDEIVEPVILISIVILTLIRAIRWFLK